MKIPAAFKVKELLTIFSVLILLIALLMGFAAAYIFQISLYIFIPFLLIGLWISFQYAHKKIMIPDVKKSSNVFLIFKMMAIALMLTLGYFAFGHGLLLYQSTSYQDGQPVLMQFANFDQLAWAIQLTLITWVSASGLMLAMIAFNKDKISQFFPKKISQSRYGIVIDVIVGMSFSVGLLFFMSIVSVEISRSAVALAGFEWPVFPELTAFILVLFLYAGYKFFHLKKRLEQLAKKSVSIGRVLFTQTFYLVSLLLIGQAFIAFFPQQMIMPLAMPMVNILPTLSYETTWLFLTLTLAMVSVPLVARLLARILTGFTLRQAALFLALPVLLAGVSLYQQGLGFVPEAYSVPMVLTNIVYRFGAAQVIIFTGFILLLLCFVSSKSVQSACVDIMPAYLSQRLRRLRELLVNEFSFLIVCTAIYLFFANIGYYFIGGIFLVLAALLLLWVSLYLFYTLTYYRKG